MTSSNGIVAKLNTILRTVVGSELAGLSAPGASDRDEMGIFIEPPDYVTGTSADMDHYKYRSQPEGVKSGPGDLDLTLYSLRKYLRLALKGNPSVLEPLFAPEYQVLEAHWLGRNLVYNRHAFLSQQAVQRFIGYLDGQVKRLKGEGKRNRVPNRPELVEQYGYDVKYAAHALRLAYQGLEIATMRNLTLPMPDEERQEVMRVRQGEVSEQQALDSVDAVRSKLVDTLDNGHTVLPEFPDYDSINIWSIQAHQIYWEAHYYG